MNLKKSDKIIAIAAVLILIIAAIGVILYTDKEPDDKLPSVDEMSLFNVKVETRSGSLMLDNADYIMSKRTPYIGTFEVPVDNLKGVQIYIEYGTQVFALLLKERRQNTITVTVYDENENQIDSKQITGKGNETISIFGSSPLNIYEIKAKDKIDAEIKLSENISSSILTNTYTIEVSIDHGGRMLRPLLRLREILGMKDSFSPQITYEYYYYFIEEPPVTNGDIDTDLSTQNLNSGVQTYRNLSLPGKN